jgi:hypothetical protein
VGKRVGRWQTAFFFAKNLNKIFKNLKTEVILKVFNRQKFCHVAKVGEDPKEDLARFWLQVKYDKLNFFLKTSFYIFGYLL